MTLRERQAVAVQAQLRDAFVQLVSRRGLHGFSLREVADLAEVSERTLYRHYENREALVAAVRAIDEQALEDQIHERLRDADIFTDPEMVAENFAVFQQHVDLVRAARLLRLESPGPAPSHGRTAQERTVLQDAGFEGPVLDQLAAVVRLLTSSDAWLRLTEEDLHLDSATAGHVVQWAVQVLVEAARASDGSLHPRVDD